MTEKIDLTTDAFLELWNPELETNALWMQQPGEKDLWYYRFKAWLMLGESRTLIEIVNQWRREVGKPDGKEVPRSWYVYKKEHEWDERAKAFDRAVSQIKNSVWAKRQNELLNREWDMATQLHERFLKMLNFPLEEVTRDQITQNGKVINRTIIKPMKWTHATAIQIAKAVSELGRMAVGMPTEHIVEDGEHRVRFYIPANTRERNAELDDFPMIEVSYDATDEKDEGNAGNNGNQTAD